VIKSSDQETRDNSSSWADTTASNENQSEELKLIKSHQQKIESALQSPYTNGIDFNGNIYTDLFETRNKDISDGESVMTSEDDDLISCFE
jgi:hypothetical protein